MFVGILVGMAGTLFVSAPLYGTLRLGERKILAHTRKVEEYRASGQAEADAASEDDDDKPRKRRKPSFEVNVINADQ